MVRKRVLALTAGLMMLGAVLTLGSGTEPAAATGRGTACKPASGRAAVYEKNRAIGYLQLEIRFCWEYFGATPVKLTSAKVERLKIQMPPDRKDRCLMTITISEHTARVGIQKQSAKVWKLTAVGTFRTRAYVDSAPRDCMHTYQLTEAWSPQVAITVSAGGKVAVYAPPAGMSVVVEHL